MAWKRTWAIRIGKTAAWLGLLLLILVAIVFLGQFVGIATPWSALAGLAGWMLLLRFVSLPRAFLATLILSIVTLFGYISQTPSNHRDWKPEISRLPRIEIQGNSLRIENLRDFSWKSASDFDPRWIEATYDLETLSSLDVLVVPFGESELLAHVMLSFGFADGRHLALSVETRPEVDEHYSLMGGAARQLELIYLFGTEPDLLGLRILHRGNRVYCFPLRASKPFIRNLLVDLSASANQLQEAPRFYATLRHNCTTTLLRHVNHIEKLPIGWQREILFPAQLGQLLHRLGYLDTDLDWPDAQDRFRADLRVRDAADLSNFSKVLRGE